jgi:hypothetical protein
MDIYFWVLEPGCHGGEILLCDTRYTFVNLD